ncbi:MAG: Glu-tRNA(Gln) amidotransferase subunit GatE [Marinifilaceae bacterium]
MNNNFSPARNYEESRKAIGYVSRKAATIADYERIGFKSGLEVHQQLDTKEKLFCHCPCGQFNPNEEYDAEIVRHMRPAMSELGGYDGTALMEFKTQKNIIYHIKNETACTYEIDDTPPFKINPQALEIALRISLLCKLNIVGEVHITRKQYLDGSIPTGFQRTAILGVNGQIQLSNKKVNLIQLSIEEDSCREMADIGHNRWYKTDRLGTPLIETVTAPELVTPDELKEAAEYIRFLNRSTGMVRTGMGAGREDVNVSCRGGARVEIKGVAHNKWIPELSHNEAFRQWALLSIREKLKKRRPKESWAIRSLELDSREFNFTYPPLASCDEKNYKIVCINLPGFHGLLSHFTQPGKIFADELAERLKVIACLEHPNIAHSEQLEPVVESKQWKELQHLLNARQEDAQLIIWGPEEDMPTAIETIEERCAMAFEGVPNETRKSLTNGITIFERVLPGADRMYPDTDSAPIPLSDEYINQLGENLPKDISVRFAQLKEWGIPEDTHNYLLSKNLMPVIEEIATRYKFSPKFLGCFLGHNFKHLEGKTKNPPPFNYRIIVGLFKFIREQQLEPGIAKYILPVLYQHPNMDFQSILTSLKFRKRTVDELMAPVDYLVEKFREIRKSSQNGVDLSWLMGQLHRQAIGNIDLKELREQIEKRIN